jgi:hypothetical protein
MASSFIYPPAMQEQQRLYHFLNIPIPAVIPVVKILLQKWL